MILRPHAYDADTLTNELHRSHGGSEVMHELILNHPVTAIRTQGVKDLTPSLQFLINVCTVELLVGRVTGRVCHQYPTCIHAFSMWTVTQVLFISR